VAFVEGTGSVIRINTNSACIVSPKPCSEQAQQCSSDTPSATVSDDIDPFELAVAMETAGKVAGYETDDRRTVKGHI
jgi:hypothetical protein